MNDNNRQYKSICLCGNTDYSGDGPHSVCQSCIALFDSGLPDASSMSSKERADELDRIADAPLSVPFSQVHQRIESLVGRPVWTHELTPVGIDKLIAEILSGDRATIQEIMSELPGGSIVLLS